MYKRFWRAFVALLLLIAIACTGIKDALADEATADYGSWQKVELPTDATLLDIAFTGSNPNHGWLTGTNNTLLETNDSGKTWEIRQLELGDTNFRLVSVSFNGDEGWIAGKPSLLLHTTDGGKSWSRIGLSSKLPGDPTLIKALSPNTAEMATDIGAIYRTQDQGQNWKALVTQSVGTVRNLYRAEDGRYIAVSAKGNFYSTWEPGESAWTQHNRNSSRRVQNMGYAPDGRTWMLNRGGQIQFSEPNTLEKWGKAEYPKAADGFGLLDLYFQNNNSAWLAAGSSRLLHTDDGGESWQRVEFLNNIGANFYKIAFFSKDKGFILGQNGALLAYSP